MEIDTNYLKTIFPDNDKLHLIKTDEEGLYSISSKNVSKFICNIIKKYLTTYSWGLCLEMILCHIFRHLILDLRV